MFVLIIGGGKVGRFLINDLLKKNNEIVLIEQDIVKANKIRDKYGIRVICGDGSQQKVLEKAGIEKCDAVMAVTEDDQDNLVICQLAERKYNIPRTFTTVNTPGNEKLFNWLGVNVAVSSAAILSALLDQEVTIKDLAMFLNKDQDKLKLIRVTVPENSKLINKKLKEIDFPVESVLVSILRGDKPIVPRGNTRILGKDMILALAEGDLREELISLFT